MKPCVSFKVERQLSWIGFQSNLLNPILSIFNMNTLVSSGTRDNLPFCLHKAKYIRNKIMNNKYLINLLFYLEIKKNM